MSETLRALIPAIDESLKRSECDEMRFALIVWCDACDMPLFIGGNGDNTPRTLQMLKRAADVVLDGHELTEGHA